MAEELIQPDNGARTPRTLGIVACLFLVAIVGTGAAEALMPPSKRRLIGEEKDKAERAAENTSWWDGSRARLIETDFRLRGRVRREVAPFWGVIMLKLGDVPNRMLVVGKGGYLFYRERVELDPIEGERSAHLLARVHAAVARCLASHGSELIVAPLPRKSVVAAARLPRGIDAHPDYDRSVIEFFGASGVRTVDLLPRWTRPGSEANYLRHDSHWARAGVVSFAEEVAQQVPELPRNTATLDHVDGPFKETIGLLGHAGVLPRHPSYRWADPEIERAYFLVPLGLEQRTDSGEEPAEILIAGSSFCQGFFARAVLACTLQAPVIDASVKGRQPLFSLGEAFLHRKPEDLPPFVITEFPIHQAATIAPATDSTMRPCFIVLNQLDQAGVARPLAPELFPGAKREAPALKRPLLRYPAGTLLSSGDGVLALRVEFESDSVTRWRYGSSGMVLSIKIPPGRHTRYLPIIESDEWSGAFTLAPQDAPALGARVTAEVVTDLDRSAARTLEVTSLPDGTLRYTGEAPVGPHGGLFLTWEEPGRGPFNLEARGRDVNGQPATQRWSFETSSGARAAAFTLGHLTLGQGAGGQLEEVTVTGIGPSVSLQLAPLLHED